MPGSIMHTSFKLPDAQKLQFLGCMELPKDLMTVHIKFDYLENKNIQHTFKVVVQGGNLLLKFSLQRIYAGDIEGPIKLIKDATYNFDTPQNGPHKVQRLTNLIVRGGSIKSKTQSIFIKDGANEIVKGAFGKEQNEQSSKNLPAWAVGLIDNVDLFIMPRVVEVRPLTIAPKGGIRKIVFPNAAIA